MNKQNWNRKQYRNMTYTAEYRMQSNHKRRRRRRTPNISINKWYSPLLLWKNSISTILLILTYIINMVCTEKVFHCAGNKLTVYTWFLLFARFAFIAHTYVPFKRIEWKKNEWNFVCQSELWLEAIQIRCTQILPSGRIFDQREKSNNNTHRSHTNSVCVCA